MVVGLATTPFLLCVSVCVFSFKEDSDPLPVLLFILENQMLQKKKALFLTFTHPRPTSLPSK